MGTHATIVSYHFTGVAGFKPSKGSHQSSLFDPLFQAGLSKKKAGYEFDSYGGLEYQKITSWTAAPRGRRSELDFAVYCSPQPENFLPSLPHLDSWLNWALGLVAIVPFAAQRLLTLTKEVDATAETVKKIADAVEKVGEDVEKVAEDIAEKLPEGGELRKVATFVENVANEIEKDARSIQDLSDKVEEVDKEIRSEISDGLKMTPKAANDEK